MKETFIPKDKEECKQFINSFNGYCIMQSNLLNLHMNNKLKNYPCLIFITCYHNNVISTTPQLPTQVAMDFLTFLEKKSNFYFGFQNVLEHNRQCNSCLTVAWANENELHAIIWCLPALQVHVLPSRIAYNVRRAATMIPNRVRITAWEEAACAEDIVGLHASVPNTKTNLGVKISWHNLL